MKVLVFLFILTSMLYSHEFKAKQLAQKLQLSAASKAIMQWERVFSSERKMSRYKIDTLSTQEKSILKEYLINHAVDSDQPTIAGV
jgi:hypothetical protein